ncbi:MAG: hypothetical protein K8S23_12280 [Candidatus Cloacimonetes bacterium]|nr:hypothetical protein [Candidatus Cloacimonadota bacterium]
MIISGPIINKNLFIWSISNVFTNTKAILAILSSISFFILMMLSERYFWLNHKFPNVYVEALPILIGIFIISFFCGVYYLFNNKSHSIGTEKLIHFWRNKIISFIVDFVITVTFCIFWSLNYSTINLFVFLLLLAISYFCSNLFVKIVMHLLFIKHPKFENEKNYIFLVLLLIIMILVSLKSDLYCKNVCNGVIIYTSTWFAFIFCSFWILLNKVKNTIQKKIKLIYTFFIIILWFSYAHLSFIIKYNQNSSVLFPTANEFGYFCFLNKLLVYCVPSSLSILTIIALYLIFIRRLRGHNYE